MSNVRTIYLDWYNGSFKATGGSQLAYQYDHLSNLVIFSNAPQLDNYYLIVEMKETEVGEVRTFEPIQLAGSFWLIPNSYTQLAQNISFQVCCKTENGDFERHSAQFTGTILPSKNHAGAELDVDPSIMFEPYKQWVSDIAMAAGAIVIDPTLSVQGAAADAKAVGDVAAGMNERLGNLSAGLYSALGVTEYWTGDGVAEIYGYDVSRFEDSLKLNGPGVDSTTRWKISGAFAYASTISAAEAWSKDFNLPAGKYIGSFYRESGSTTANESNAFVRAYDSENNRLFQISLGSLLEFDFSGGDILFVQSNGPGTYTNAVYRFRLYKQTDVDTYKEAVQETLSPAWIDYGMVNRTTGEIDSASSAAWKYTPFYEIPSGTENVKLSVYASGSAAGIAFYTASATYISGTNVTCITNAESKLFSIPATAKYVRFTNNTGTNYHRETPLIVFLRNKNVKDDGTYKRLAWKKGIYTGGTFSSSETRMCTANPIHVDRPFRISLADNWRAWISYYANGLWVKDGVQAHYKGYVPEPGYDIYVSIGKRDGSNITDVELATASMSIAVILKDEEETDRLLAQSTPAWMSMSLFQKIGVLGDSYASGSLHHPDGSGSETNYAVSWPQILGRAIGADVTNYSKGGLSATTWLSNADYGLAKLLAEDAEQLYICAFGINDWNTRSTYPIGTVADCKTDFTQNPATFYGSYGKVIGNIKAHAPDAKIVLLTVMRENERQLDGDIETIAEHFSLPCIKVPDDDFFVSEFFSASQYENHPASYGYAGIAKAIKRLLCKCVIDNTDYFKTYYGNTA